MSTDIQKRFLAKSVMVASGCREWQSTLHRDGYGKFWHDGGTRAAHRVAYELFVGPIPAGLHVCHTCDNRRCVNPAHLFVGTPQDNVLDMHAKGRAWGRRKLSDDDVRRAQALRAAGISQAEIARAIGVSQTSISRLELGRRAFASRIHI